MANHSQDSECLGRESARHASGSNIDNWIASVIVNVRVAPMRAFWLLPSFVEHRSSVPE